MIILNGRALIICRFLFIMYAITDSAVTASLQSQCGQLLTDDAEAVAKVIVALPRQEVAQPAPTPEEVYEGYTSSEWAAYGKKKSWYCYPDLPRECKSGKSID